MNEVGMPMLLYDTGSEVVDYSHCHHLWFDSPSE